METGKNLKWMDKLFFSNSANENIQILNGLARNSKSDGDKRFLHSIEMMERRKQLYKNAALLAGSAVALNHIPLSWALTAAGAGAVYVGGKKALVFRGLSGWEIRYTNIPLPFQTVIYKDTILLLNWSKKPAIFKIRCERIAGDYMRFFENM